MQKGRKPIRYDSDKMLRDQVFQSVVMARRPVTAAEVAALLGRKTTHNTKKRLHRLEAEGFISRGSQRGKRNRPAATFQPTLTREAVERLELITKQQPLFN